MAQAGTTGHARPRKWRAWWMRQVVAWHWISAAISLAAMLLFAITGITLNHAASIAATPRVTHSQGVLPPPLLQSLAGGAVVDAPPTAPPTAPLPAPVARMVAQATGLDPAGHAAEWTDEEVYVALPRPGGDAWVRVDRRSGAIEGEATDRGWISYLNDLHKGRNAGAAWFWFIDVFAAACVLFSITGLLLLQLHARRRPGTWPLVAAGLALPVLLAIVFIH